jgi:hypothetical protein
MPLAFDSYVDSIEDNGDRLAVRFVSRPGPFWVMACQLELVTLLRRSIHTGEVMEVLYNQHSLEIVDVIAR